MPITTSTYKANPQDPDGRRYVIERHIDHLGREHMIDYMCPPGEDPSVILASRAVSLGSIIDQILASESLRSLIFDDCGHELLEALTWLVKNIRAYPNVTYATAETTWNATWSSSLFTFAKLAAWGQARAGNITWDNFKTYVINHTFRWIDGE